MKTTKSIKKLAALIALAAFFAAVAPAQATVFSLTANGVDFTFDGVDGANSFTVTMAASAGMTENWATATHLGSIGFKNNMGVDFNTATDIRLTASPTATDPSPWVGISGEMNAQGCQDPNNNDSVICFTGAPTGSPLSLLDYGSFVETTLTVTWVGDGLALSTTIGPHLKVQMVNDDCTGKHCKSGYVDDNGDGVYKKVGTLVSLDMAETTVPAPASLALMSLALLGIGAVRKTRIGKV